MSTLDRTLKLISKQYPSYSAFEETAGLKSKTVDNWKRGRSQSFMKMLPKLSELFGVSVNYLLEETDDPTPLDKKNAPLELMGSKEALKQFLIKEGVIPADRDVTEEEAQTLSALADAFFNKGKKE